LAKPNYAFEKRKRELEKKQRKEEKLQKKREAKQASESVGGEPPASEPEAPPT
jgi:hypothetical protein